MSEQIDGEVVSQWSHSIKYNYASTGIRPDIHVWANDRQTAVDEAFETYKATILKLEQEALKDPAHAEQYKLAPFEVKKPKENGK